MYRLWNFVLSLLGWKISNKTNCNFTLLHHVNNCLSRLLCFFFVYLFFLSFFLSFRPFIISSARFFFCLHISLLLSFFFPSFFFFFLYTFFFFLSFFLHFFFYLMLSFYTFQFLSIYWFFYSSLFLICAHGETKIRMLNRPTTCIMFKTPVAGCVWRGELRRVHECHCQHRYKTDSRFKLHCSLLLYHSNPYTSFFRIKKTRFLREQQFFWIPTSARY